MPKPIRLTEDLIQQMMLEFGESLRKANLADGKVSYSKAFSWKDDTSKVTVLFEPAAYAKMLLLLHNFNNEVAWHGTVDRLADDCFVVKDILVYPQKVTGVTVETDQERYQTWLMELDDEVANALHMQGHSHVNMATTPSTTDLAHQEAILSQLRKDDFYIFMIFNKRLEHTVKVYDLKTNTLYESADVSIGIFSDTGDLETFLADAKDDVVETKPAVTYNYGGSAYAGHATYARTAGFKSLPADDDDEPPVKKNGDAPASPGSSGGFVRYPGYYRPPVDYDDDGIDYDALMFGRRNYD